MLSNTITTKRAVLFIMLTLVIIKVITTPSIFDLNYSTQSVHGWTKTDLYDPFTVYYIQNGNDFMRASQDLIVKDDTILINGNASTIAWFFNLDGALDCLKRVKSQSNTINILLSDPFPVAETSNAWVAIFVNNELVDFYELNKQISQNQFTWKLSSVHDRLGTAHAAWKLASIDISNFILKNSESKHVELKIVVSGGVRWNIDKVIIRVHSDYKKLNRPWFQTNLTVWLIPFISTTFMFLFLLQNKDKIKKLFNHSNYRLMTVIIAGLILRLYLAGLTENYDWQSYKGLCVLTYYYGLDMRDYGWIYGTLWLYIILLTYPFYLLIQQFLGSSIFLERLLIKMPFIVGDFIVGYLLYKIGYILNRDNAKLIALAWIFNPYAIWMTTIWGIVHSFSVVFTVLALKEFIYKRLKESGIALSLACFTGSYPIALLPLFYLGSKKMFGRGVSRDFLLFFILGSTLCALPWTLGLSIFYWAFHGGSYSGRMEVPYLSYSTLLSRLIVIPWYVFPILIIGIILTITVLLVKIRNLNYETLNDFIAIMILSIFVCNMQVFQTYVLWSLPFLFISTFIGNRINKSTLIVFMAIPVVWTLFWNPLWWFVSHTYYFSYYWPLGWPTFPDTIEFSIYRDVLGLNFALISTSIIIRLLSHSLKAKNKSNV